jgi:hypothetical protein
LYSRSHAGGLRRPATSILLRNNSSLILVCGVMWTLGLLFTAPAALAQEHVPDAHTLLLLHFNNSLVGAAGESPLQATGVGYGAGIFGNGADFPAGNRLTYAASGNITASQGTAEFWFKPSWSGNDSQDHLALTWGSGGGILFGKDGGNYWRIIVNRYGLGGHPERGCGLYVGNEWHAGEWHHCAFTWSGVEVQLYIDGVLRAHETVGYSLPAITASSLQIGGEGTSASLQGVVDEWRLSDSVRSADEIFESFARGLTFTALDVQPDPLTVTEGFSATPLVSATSQGGQPYSVPPAGCTWTVADTTIAQADAAGHIVGRRGGTTGATCAWHGVSDAFTIIVQAASPPPTGLAAEGFHTTAYVHWNAATPAGAVGYDVQRRLAGGTFASVKRVLARTSFTDYNLTSGQAYEYRACAIDAGGMPLTQYSSSCTVTPNLAAGAVTHARNFEVLVAIYKSGYTTDQVNQMIEGLEKSMTFYWRTTGMNLNLDPTWLVIDAPPPAPEWNTLVEDDLRSRGVQNDQYDLAYMIGQNLSGCWGGWVVLGSTCAALGTVCGVPYPESQAGVDYTIAWTFTHETHHALETMENITGDATPEVLFCHFPWCYPDPLGETGWHMDWAAHYNGIGETNREYGDSWMTYPAPYDGVIECVDADGDGMPDNDARVWQDEARFGSNASRADTDYDGLGDLEEYCRYDFRGTDPNDADTDGDLVADGIDSEPLYRTPPYMVKFATAPLIDGVIEPSWPVLAQGYYYTQNGTPFTLKTYAGWSDGALYMAFESSRKLRFMVSLDGSGQDGRFESPARHNEGTTDSDNADTKGQQIGDSYGDGNHIYFSHGAAGAEVWGRSTISGAQVASSILGGIYRTEVKIPATLPGGAAYTWYPPGAGTPVVNGLTLQAGQVIGVNVTMSNYDGSDGNEFSGTWTSLFETHSYVDFPLGLPTSGAGEVTVGGAPGFYLANPYPRGSEIVLRGATGVAVGVPGEVRVYDVMGRLVRTLRTDVAGTQSGSSGLNDRHFAWDGKNESGHDVSPGVYYLRAHCGQEHLQRRMVVLGR